MKKLKCDYIAPVRFEKVFNKKGKEKTRPTEEFLYPEDAQAYALAKFFGWLHGKAVYAPVCHTNHQMKSRTVRRDLLKDMARTLKKTQGVSWKRAMVAAKNFVDSTNEEMTGVQDE